VGIAEYEGMTPATTSAQIQTEATIRIADFTTLPNLLSLARICRRCSGRTALFRGSSPRDGDPGNGRLPDRSSRRLSRAPLVAGERARSELDQAADSFTTAIAMAMLVIAGGFPFVFLLIFLLREFWVATVRRYAALGHVEIPSHILGKLATAFMYYAMLLMAIALMLDIPEAIARGCVHLRSSAWRPAWRSAACRGFATRSCLQGRRNGVRYRAASEGGGAALPGSRHALAGRQGGARTV
jgi:hypothetical protein